MNTKLIKSLKERHEELKEWQEEMHRNPELSMQEVNTAKFIADKLKSFGDYEVVEGVGK